MTYTHRTQKRNYSQYFLEFLSLSHHMVAFLVSYNLSKHSQASQAQTWYNGVSRAYSSEQNTRTNVGELNGKNHL